MSDDKPNPLREALESAKRRAQEALTTIPPELREHVQVDAPNLRVFVSHKVVQTAVKAAASYSPEIALEDLVPVDGGYRCRARVKGVSIQVDLGVESITWSRGEVIVGINTPDGVELEARPLSNLVVAGIVSLFGGTMLGELVLSATLPPQIQWDGHRATWTIEVPTKMMPPWTKNLSIARLRVTHGARGMWITFDARGTLLAFLAWLVIGALNGFT